MKKLPLSLEYLHVGVIYEVEGDQFQLTTKCQRRPNTFDLVGLNGRVRGKVYKRFVFEEWIFTKYAKNIRLWAPEPVLPLEEML